MAAESQRTARIEARISPEALKVVRRAAEMQGRSVSDFVVAAAQDHDRTAFSCGLEALDRYFREQAPQDIKRRVATCFVATRVGTLDGAGCWSKQRMKRRDDFMSALVFRS